MNAADDVRAAIGHDVPSDRTELADLSMHIAELLESDRKASRV